MSTGDVASIFARYHFRAHFFQHAGFRVIHPLAEADEDLDFYEQQTTLNEYLTFHFPTSLDYVFPYASFLSGMENVYEFPRRIGEKVLQVAEREGVSMHQCVDIGCAVGRSCFEIARKFEHVIGIDFSRSFIDACLKIKESFV